MTIQPHYYHPPFGDAVAAHIEAGRRANGEADEFLELMGCAPLRDCPADEQIRRAMDAIAGGMASGCWLSVAEGVAILQDLEAQLRTK